MTQVFYPRNLNTKDIEGTEPGSLNTKFMKNWQLAQELKAYPPGIPKTHVSLLYPYGDGINKEEYLPEHLRRAREIAGRNRNKLRAINAAVNPYEGRYGVEEQGGRGENGSERFGQPPSTYHRDDYHSGEGVGREGGNPEEKRYEDRAEEEERYREYIDREYKRMEKERRENEELREKEIASQTEKENRDMYWRERVAAERNGVPPVQDNVEPEYRAVQQNGERPMAGYGQSFNPDKVRFEMDELDRLREESKMQQSANGNQVQMQHGPRETLEREGSSGNIRKRDRAGWYPKPDFVPEKRGRYTNQEEERENSQQNMMRTSGRGFAKDYSLEANPSEKLRKLNEFYSEFMSEQNKRKKPFTKDDYNYLASVKHMKTNGIL